MKHQPFIIALALVLLTACQVNSPADWEAIKTLDSSDLSRLAYEHQSETRQERRNSDATFIPPGTPVEMTGVCEIARTAYPDSTAYDPAEKYYDPKSDPDNPSRHKQQSQVLVPRDTPGLEILRPLTTLGYDDAPIGHAEIQFNDVRVPLENMLLGEGRGFEIAQGRLGPGRIHHCMRLIGAAQRSLELACKRATLRTTFGRILSQHQSVREDISRCFSEIEMARLLVLKTCLRMDEVGPKDALDLIAASKTSVPLMVQNIIDRCMQIHGAGGLTEDYCMAEAFNYARWCRQADGPDQVHQMALGKMIINRYAPEQD